MSGSFAEVAPAFLSRPTAELCRRPYAGHPRGCPNLGKKMGCPAVPPLREGTARKQLEMVIEIALGQFPANRGEPLVLRCPEAHGVDVTTTMLSLGVKLEWPPVTVAYQVALLGVAKR